MKRKAPIIPLADLEAKLAPYIDDLEDFCLYDLTIEKDLSKIEFDMENHSNADPDSGFLDYPVGFKVLPNDLPVLFVNAGGDWEGPICFIIYWDGTKLRAYIPDKGNLYDRVNMAAHGNYDDVTGETVEKCNEEEMIKDIVERIEIVKDNL